jgi:hypothetical protein
MPNGGLYGNALVSNADPVVNWFGGGLTGAVAFSSGLARWGRTAADSTVTVGIALPMIRRVERSGSTSLRGGVKLTKVEVKYSCATAALDSTPTVVLRRQIGTTVSTITATNDFTLSTTSGFVTRTVTVTTPAHDGANDDVLYTLGITLNCAGTSAVRLAQATPYFDGLS